jgi:pyruvate formate lyase activating enzyme
MNIGGYQPCSLCDYPGDVASVVFTQGCNFRCPFCHNPGLLPLRPSVSRIIPETAILERLRRRQGQIDAVVVSGGEPTLQPDLIEFLQTIRTLGLKIKLDTNGSRPDVLTVLLGARLLDYVAMDVKASWPRYAELAGASVCEENLLRSVRLIAASGIAHEFRTTIVPALITDQELATIRAQIPNASTYRTQPFQPEHALATWLRVPTKAAGLRAQPRSAHARRKRFPSTTPEVRFDVRTIKDG